MAADDLARAAYEPAADAYKAACIFARCILLADKDSKLSASRRTDLADSYANRAMAALHQAVTAGYKDAGIKKDKDLDPLRPRADFQKLLADLKSTQAAKP